MNHNYINATIHPSVAQMIGTIILPPGSQSADLQAAIDGAASGDVIIISGDMDFTSAVSIPPEFSVTIQSSAENQWVLTQTAPGFRHFTVLGTLMLHDITLDGNTPENPGGIIRGGVQVQPGGAFEMRGETTIRNCYSGNGGGVEVTGGRMTMQSGHIIGNRAGAGGGVYIAANGELTIFGGQISGNRSTYGGGVYLTQESTCLMTGGVIGGVDASDANLATTYGGGAGVYYDSAFVLDGGFIEGNRAISGAGGNGGGGVYVIHSSTLDLRSGAIRNNIVSAGADYPSFGGGVMLGELTYVVPPGLAPTSTLLMSGGSIDGNEADTRGGGVAIVANCNFYMSGGAIRGNTANTNPNGGGGGVYIGTVLETTGETFTMDGGEITENTGMIGGGVLVSGSTSSASYFARFVMNSGTIANNESAVAYGGGVCVLNLGGQLFAGSAAGGFIAPVISGNRSTTDGGGVYTNTTCAFNGAIISDNTAINGNGGGLYVTSAGTLNVLGDSFITGNAAPGGNGGGIYTENYDYSDPANTAAYANIATAASTVFSDNSAIAAYVPPTNASSFTNIGYAETSIRDTNGYIHPLNNFDINYVGLTELLLYTVTYRANGGTGGLTVTNLVGGSSYSLLPLEDTGILRGGYTFTGWNTAANGSGTAYRPGESIAITSDIILYAQWTANETPGCKPCCKACGPCWKLCKLPLCCKSRCRQRHKVYYIPCRNAPDTSHCGFCPCAHGRCVCKMPSAMS